MVFKSLHFVDSPVAWTATVGPEVRELMITISGWIANQYSRRLSENTKAGMERARANGKR